MTTPETDKPAAERTPLLDVERLCVTFRKKMLFKSQQVVRAVNDVNLRIAPGETLGLVGESGSGKSTAGRAILKLVPIESGRVSIEGRDIAAIRGKKLRRIRAQMQMVFQDPYSSLDPSATIATSIGEPLRVHTDLTRTQIRERVEELLGLVGLRSSHAERYPYEFSGGQRQRVVIARALALNPRLIVCDEAVSALDVSTQNQVINLLEEIRDRFSLSYLFIAHDLAVVRHISHRVAVMYLGRIVEMGPTQRLYESPAHPYTQALLSAIPVPSPRHRGEARRVILEGGIPDPSNPPSGCPFHTRCAYAMDICAQAMPEMTAVDDGGEVACHLQTSGPQLRGRCLDRLDSPDAAGGEVAGGRDHSAPAFVSDSSVG